jgi:hypothetical protein
MIFHFSQNSFLNAAGKKQYKSSPNSNCDVCSAEVLWIPNTSDLMVIENI